MYLVLLSYMRWWFLYCSTITGLRAAGAHHLSPGLRFHSKIIQVGPVLLPVLKNAWRLVETCRPPVLERHGVLKTNAFCGETKLKPWIKYSGVRLCRNLIYPQQKMRTGEDFDYSSWNTSTKSLFCSSLILIISMPTPLISTWPIWSRKIFFRTEFDNVCRMVTAHVYERFSPWMTRKNL